MSDGGGEAFPEADEGLEGRRSQIAGAGADGEGVVDRDISLLCKEQLFIPAPSIPHHHEDTRHTTLLVLHLQP